MIPRSGLSVSVKYQDHIFKENCKYGGISVSETQLVLIVGQNVWLFTDRQNFRLVQIQNIYIQQNNSDSKIEIYFGKSRKHCGERRKCWLPAFSPFPTVFSKAFFSRGVKSQDRVVKS